VFGLVGGVEGRGRCGGVGCEVLLSGGSPGMAEGLGLGVGCLFRFGVFCVVGVMWW